MRLYPLPDFDTIFPRSLTPTELTELARALVCFKLIPDEMRGFESPLINDLLEQAIARTPSIPAAMTSYAGPLRDAFNGLMFGDGPSAQRDFLASLPDDTARRTSVTDFFLPLIPVREVPLAPWTDTGSAFEPVAAPAAKAPPDAPLAFARGLVPVQFSLILTGRFSHRYLEQRRRGETDSAAADSLIATFRDFVARLEDDDASPDPLPPFWAPELRSSDFAASEAYAHMMELGFSRDEMMEAMAPWTLVD